MESTTIKDGKYTEVKSFPLQTMEERDEFLLNMGFHRIEGETEKYKNLHYLGHKYILDLNGKYWNTSIMTAIFNLCFEIFSKSGKEQAKEDILKLIKDKY